MRVRTHSAVSHPQPNATATVKAMLITEFPAPEAIPADLVRKYYDRGPRRTISALSAAFARLAHRGELAMDDPRRAATQFAFLVVGEPLDTAMFRGAARGRRRRELDALAEAGVEVFLAAYGRQGETQRFSGAGNANR